jgi:potassium channel subfamily K
MSQTLAFFIFTGLAALIFSKVEGVTYVDGIYYMVVTTLTIGFGDVTAHTKVLKILTFPFAVTGITLLALIVTSIVRLLQDRARRRKRDVKRQFREKASEKKRIHAGNRFKLSRRAREIPGDGPRLQQSLTLQEELNELREEQWKKERRHNIRSVVQGIIVFLAFWFLGALIFHFVEV